MWYVYEYFKTQKEALRCAAEVPENRAKRVEPLEKSDDLYREGFRWTVQAEKETKPR